jgi:Transcriptional regulatory protein, C terminal
LRRVGGATRILIIDDDPHPASIPPPDQDAGQRSDFPLERTGEPVNDALAGIDGRPVVHEYQVAQLRTGPEPADSGRAEPEQSGNALVVRELIARVQELLNRTRNLPAGASSGWGGTIRFGSVMVEPATQTVLRGGQPVRVTHTEFRLLLALMRRRGAIASRVELLREVWGAGTGVSRRAVDTHIARLRRKLEDDPANPRHILTALAWGYRFRP